MHYLNESDTITPEQISGNKSAKRTSYVAGLGVDGNPKRILLRKKTKPAWQAGKLNGVGGKIEPGETAYEAMAREFREETGIYSVGDDWKLTVQLIGDDFEVFFFRTYGDISKAENTTDEKVVKVSYWIDGLPNNVMPNLKWLIPMSFDDQINFPIQIFDKVSKE